MLIRVVTKSKQQFLDQYRVYFMSGSCLTIKANTDSSQGISCWEDCFGLHDGIWEEAIENNNQLILMGNVEELINFSDLPSVIQAHIEKAISDVEENK